MNTETMPASGVAAEQVTPVENVNEQPEVTTPESESSEQAQTTDANADNGDGADKSIKRMERRLGRVTAARYQAEAEAQQLRAQLARYEQQTQPEGKQEAPQVDPYKLAEEIATAKQITDRSNSAFSDGVKAYGDSFKASVSAVIDEAGPLINERGLPTALGEAVLDSDKPADLLHYLGQNPDIAESLHGLSAARLGRRIEAIEREMKTAKVSKAPAPLQPVTPKGAPITKAESSMSDAEWYAARRKRS